MADKNITPVEEVNAEEPEKISGGSIDNVSYTETQDISDDTQEKIK